MCGTGSRGQSGLSRLDDAGRNGGANFDLPSRVDDRADSDPSYLGLVSNGLAVSAGQVFAAYNIWSDTGMHVQFVRTLDPTIPFAAFNTRAELNLGRPKTKDDAYARSRSISRGPGSVKAGSAGTGFLVISSGTNHAVAPRSRRP